MNISRKILSLRRTCRIKATKTKFPSNVSPACGYGSSHPSLQGKLDEARSLFERALAVLRKSLGEDHQHTSIVLNALKELDESQVSTPTTMSCASNSTSLLLATLVVAAV